MLSIKHNHCYAGKGTDLLVFVKATHDATPITEAENMTMTEVLKCITLFLRRVQLFMTPGTKEYYVDEMEDNEEAAKTSSSPPSIATTRNILIFVTT